MNAKYLAVITLLAASLVGAAQSQAGTVNRGTGSYSGGITTGGSGSGSGSASSAIFYTSVLRAQEMTITNTVGTMTVTNRYPSILGTARFQVDTNNAAQFGANTYAFNNVPSVPTAGYVNLSSGGSILSGDVVGTFTFNEGGTNHIIAAFMAQNVFLTKIQDNALTGDYVVAVSASINSTSTNGNTFYSNDYNPCQRVLSTGVDNGDNTVTYTVYNTSSNNLSSLVYRR
jgi:hypothetical protein